MITETSPGYLFHYHQIVRSYLGTAIESVTFFGMHPKILVAFFIYFLKKKIHFIKIFS